jgi:diphthamide synthase (EF-2-diphthine--ammonia ligase)
VRKYREDQLGKTDIDPIFPLWGTDTKMLAQNIIRDGFKAVVVAIDTDKISSNLIGSEYNNEFLNKLPDDVDPCGENGEFHTFVYDAPIYKKPIQFSFGKIIENNGMMFLDVLPNEDGNE